MPRYVKCHSPKFLVLVRHFSTGTGMGIGIGKRQVRVRDRCGAHAAAARCSMLHHARRSRGSSVVPHRVRSAQARSMKKVRVRCVRKRKLALWATDRAGRAWGGCAVDCRPVVTSEPVN